MDIQYYGANCIKLTTKKASIVIDDNLAELGAKPVAKDDEIVLTTVVKEDLGKTKPKLFINQAGEYEISEVTVLGIPTKTYTNKDKTFDGTIYKLEGEDVSVAVIGDSTADITDSQIEALGEVNVLVIPVGGNETTLSAKEALDIIKKIEPQIVIPTHYQVGNIKYPTPQASLEEAIKELGMEPSETTPKLKLKGNSFTEGEAAKLVVLEV